MLENKGRSNQKVNSALFGDVLLCYSFPESNLPSYLLFLWVIVKLVNIF